MKQNLFNKLWLRVGMIVAIMTTALSGTAWAETWTHTFASPEAISNNSITVDGATWNVTTTAGAGAPTMSTGNYSKTYGLKFGSSKSIYYGSVTFSTDYFNSYNVQSVTVNILNNGSKQGTLTAQQGITSIGSNSSTFGTTWTDLTVNTNSGSGGSLSFTYSVEQAFYIHSITVTYTTGGTPATTHSLTYNASPADGGSLTVGSYSSSPATVAEGATVNISATANSGYEFNGWTVTGTGSSVADASNASTTFTMGTANATLTANFTAVQTYTVTYHANVTGTADIEEEFNEGTDVTVASNTFTNSGYAFTKWNTSADGNGINYFPNATISNISADVDLYAQWEALTYDFTQIDFTNWGSYAEQTVTYSDAEVYFASASKQTPGQTIDNQPVTKGGDVELKLTDGSTMSKVTFYCTQWGTKTQTITLHYSTDGGTTYDDFDPAVTSTNFIITKDNLPTGTNAVKITFSNASNQVGITGVSIEKIVSTDPSITADDFDIAYDATEGSFSYTINNPAQDGSVDIDFDSDGDWLLSATEDNGTVSFTCTANNTNAAREGYFEITYTYNTNETVTKGVWVTQAAAPVIYSTIPALFNKATEVGNTATNVNVTFNNWVVSGVSTNGKNVFVTDNSGKGFVIYYGSDMSETFAAGKILSGTAVSCKVQLYKGYAEVTNLDASDLTITTGGTVSVANVAMASLAGDNTGALVHYENLTCSINNNKYYLSDGTTTIQVYNSLFAFEALTSGTKYNITGVYQQFDETKEILPRSAADIEEYVDNRDEAGLAWSASEVNIELNASDGDYTLPTLTNPNSLTVTYESSDENVAIEVDGTILVETSAVGTATITASFAGNDDYKPASVSYTISVYDPNVKGTIDNPYTVAEVNTGNYSGNNYVIGYIVGYFNGATSNATTSGTANTVSNVALSDSPSEISGANTIAVQLPQGAIRDAWNIYENAVIGYKVLVYGNITGYFTNKTGVKSTSEITAVSVPAKFNTSGYATFASTYPLDFSDDSEFSAWQITAANKTSGVLTFTQITGTVAAETGILLKGTASETVSIPVAASGSDISSTNLLEAVTTATGVTAGQYYGLKGNQFVPVNAGTVPAGKALLPVAAATGVKAFVFDFGDDATGISLMEDGRSQMEDGAIYNVAGQRISKMQKGINIVNGKKIAVK